LPLLCGGFGGIVVGDSQFVAELLPIGGEEESCVEPLQRIRN